MTLNHLKFLIVDDSVYWRRIIRTMLYCLGGRDVYEAENGASGFQSFLEQSPDVLITDWVMPAVDGLELAKMIRQPSTKDNNIPIIMLTCYTEKSRVMAARSAGITEFLAKPVSPTALYNRIAHSTRAPRFRLKTEGIRNSKDRHHSMPGSQLVKQSSAVSSNANELYVL